MRTLTINVPQVRSHHYDPAAVKLLASGAPVDAWLLKELFVSVEPHLARHYPAGTRVQVVVCEDGVEVASGEFELL